MEFENLTKKIFEYMLPFMVHLLVKKGKYKGIDLEAHHELDKILVENADECLENVDVPIGVSEMFLKWSKKALDGGDNHVAIVLIAAAFEQELNNCYRFLLREDGFSDEDITKIVKHHNIDAKLSWLLKMTAHTQLGDELRKKVKLIFDIRNSVIHYKAVPSKLDQDVGSFEKIELELQKLQKMNLINLFEQFYDKLREIIITKDNDWVLSHKIAQKIINYRFGNSIKEETQQLT